MGAKDSKSGDTGDRRNSESIVVQHVSDIGEQAITQAFRLQASGGQLGRAQFHEALRVCEELKLRRLRETPLADRLFYIFDVDKDGSVSESEFVKGMMVLTRGSEKDRISMTFQAYDKQKTTTVSRDELVEVFASSWECAWKIVSEQLGDEAGPSAAQIDTMARDALSHPLKFWLCS